MQLICPLQQCGSMALLTPASSSLAEGEPFLPAGCSRLPLSTLASFVGGGSVGNVALAVLPGGCALGTLPSFKLIQHDEQLQCQHGHGCIMMHCIVEGSQTPPQLPHNCHTTTVAPASALHLALQRAAGAVSLKPPQLQPWSSGSPCWPCPAAPPTSRSLSFFTSSASIAPGCVIWCPFQCPLSGSERWQASLMITEVQLWCR